MPSHCSKDLVCGTSPLLYDTMYCVFQVGEMSVIARHGRRTKQSLTSGTCFMRLHHYYMITCIVYFRLERCPQKPDMGGVPSHYCRDLLYETSSLLYNTMYCVFQVGAMFAIAGHGRRTKPSLTAGTCLTLPAPVGPATSRE